MNYTDIYVVRHAESVANVEHRLASRTDVPLSENGERQAEALAAALRGRIALSAVVSSPLTRAYHTAAAIAEVFGLEVTIREELTEQHLGRFSGMSYREVEQEPGYCHDRTARWDWIPEGGGESYQMIARRLEPFFQWLEARESEGPLIVVTHAVTMRLIRGHLEQTLPAYPETIAGNGEVWHVQYSRLGDQHTVETLALRETRVTRHGA